MADFGIGCCLWAKDGGSRLDLWGFPRELCDRAERWLRNYFEDRQSPIGQTREQYYREGLEIATEVKRILGPAYAIKYRFISARSVSKQGLQWESLLL